MPGVPLPRRLRLSAPLIFVLATSCVAALGQQPAERYKAAQAVLKAHIAEFDILNDDSREAHDALAQMWNAVGDAVIEILNAQPNASPQEIDGQLCRQLVAAAGCNEGFSPQHDVIVLGKDLFAVAVATANGGTVLILGRHDGKLAQLWSLATATVTREQDPRDLIGAWRLDRTGGTCREKESLHKPGSCGPLYAELGLLPPDGQGRPRFYIDAGYEQTMGATIGKQTSIWRWEGDHAELQWIDWYDYMIDQALGTSFDNDKGMLHVGQKSDFKTMYSCGSCIDRALDRMVLLTKNGVKDLGVRSLAPELDRIDELFSRLQKGQATVGIASSQVVAFLRQGIAEAKKESKKIDPQWFSVGMIDSSMVKLTATGADVCLEPDGELGTLNFTLRRTADGGYFIERVTAPADGAECERGLFLPLAAQTMPQQK